MTLPFKISFRNQYTIETLPVNSTWAAADMPVEGLLYYARSKIIFSFEIIELNEGRA
jgi:hypothetical protein